jgi:peptide chain release factor 2
MHALQQERTAISSTIEPFQKASADLVYLEESAGILDEEDGAMFAEEIAEGIVSLEEFLDNLEIKALLSGEHDRSNAILTINAGAGGLESQDWSEMLLRMYLRWAEINGYKTEIMDLQPAAEGGIKSATVLVSGLFAYGYLKVESGVHRLVRISPYDANKRRHTSFSAVLIYPEIEDNVEINIDDDDIRVDTYRASGAGGQHVNKTSSAIRITHFSTGIVVTCQSDRSQHRNREMAMKILMARLYDHEMRQKEKERKGIMGEKKEIAFGSQIRSYVLHPYKMIKDHRTDLSIGNVDKVLDGDIEPFIKAALKEKVLG